VSKGVKKMKEKIDEIKYIYDFSEAGDHSSNPRPLPRNEDDLQNIFNLDGKEIIR